MHELTKGDLICIDSCIVIWGIKKDSNGSDREKIPVAVNFIEECSNKNVKIVIPSIALGEVLSGCDVLRRNALLTEISKRFIVAPYDAMAALHYAEMWRSRETRINGLSEKPTRNALKADFMIIAIARAQKASCIYTSEGELNVFNSFADGKIQVDTLPAFIEQLEILE